MSNAVKLVDKNVVPFDNLKARLTQEAAKNPQLHLTINADKNAPWYRIVSVMDIAKELKIKSVSASTKDASKP
jgi:biopolymer transport protein ExbD